MGYMSTCEKCGFPNDPGYIGDSRICICNYGTSPILPFIRQRMKDRDMEQREKNVILATELMRWSVYGYEALENWLNLCRHKKAEGTCYISPEKNINRHTQTFIGDWSPATSIVDAMECEKKLMERDKDGTLINRFVERMISTVDPSQAMYSYEILFALIHAGAELRTDAILYALWYTV